METTQPSMAITPVIPAASDAINYYGDEEYADYPSQAWDKAPSCQTAGSEICLRDQSLEQFWRAAIKAIRDDVRGDVDGRIFTSEELDVYLGPWDVAVKHRYAWIEKTGGDSYMGFGEEYSDLEEGFKVVGVYDPDSDQNLPGVVSVLNRYYEEHKMKL